ncbi:MAG: EAL domain-containing protein, partial [Pseudomonadota bacterium]|nr:EAL domain-containing protein [Pseudomonadota bacterium]
MSATSRQTIQNLLIHGRLLEQSAQSVGELIRELLSVPVEDTQGLIDDLIGEALQNLERKTWYYRMVLYVGFILVASYLLLTFYRLNSTRLGLIQSNRELKQRYRLQKRAEQMLRLHEIAFYSAHEAIMLTDENKRIKVVNPAFERITGFTEAEVIGQDPGILKSGRHDAAFYETMWQEIFKDGRWRGEIWNRNKDGEVYPEMLSITAVNDSEGDVSNYVAVFSDIGHIKRHETELRKMAYFDSLTGLPNRALLAERMSWAMANSKRTRSHLAACYLDLDGFKPVNDALGHDAGDQLLVELASRFKSTLRGDDTVARIGGDEFIFLFLNLASAEEAQVAVSRLLQSVSQPVRLRGEEISVSASIGVALYPDNSVDADTLIRFADQAMYEAKQKGRNRYSFFDPSKEHLTRSHHEKLNEVTQALGKGEFVLHYQPKINIRQDLVEGMEALIRWQHPERGLLLPGDFLPVIEGSEVIVDLGKWVIEQAISDMSDWLAAGLSMPVSVNVSAEQLQEKRFIEHLDQSLKKNSELPAQHLQLEILETTALDDIVSVSNLIQECHELGVSVALDDFGTGYSSLTYLKRLPASCLKIDRSFVQDINSDPESLALVRGIMGLARAFGKKAIAEGVESVEHGALLLKLGCDRVQGFAIARPMPASAVEQWLRDWQLPEHWRQLSQLHWDDEDYPLIASGIEHKRWVDRLIESISRGQPIPHANFGSYHKCNFGRWYYAPTTVQRYGQLQEFTAIEEPHREIHRIAENIDVHYRQGREDEVLSLVEKLKCYRDKVVNAVA